jgi:hypothetical protein
MIFSPTSYVLGKGDKGDKGDKGASGSGSVSGNGTIIAGHSYTDVAHGLGSVPSAVSITDHDLIGLYEFPLASIGLVTFRLQYKGGVLQPPGTTAHFIWTVLP